MRVILGLLLAAGVVLAQGPPRPGMFPWWDRPMVEGLNLTDAQRNQIAAITRDYRKGTMDARAAVNRAEANLDAVFNEDSVDERKGGEAVERLAKSRGDLTKIVSEMTLKMRMVLTAQQWLELQRRQAGGGPNAGSAGSGSAPQDYGRGRRGRGPKGPPPQPQGSAPTSAQSAK